MSIQPIAASAAANQKILNAFVTYNPEVMHTSNTRWSRFWQVAALITAIAFTALATFAIVYTTMHFPIHLPTVSILVFAAGMPTSFQIFARMWDKKEAYAHEAAIDKKLIEYSKKFTSTDQSFNGMALPADFNQQKLASLLARYQYFADESMQYFQEYIDLFTRLPSKQVIDVDFSDKKAVEDYRQLYGMRVKVVNLASEAAMAAIKAAYLLHLAKNPYDNRPISHFFKLNNIDCKERLVAKMFRDGSADILISTPEKSYTPMDILEISFKNMNRFMEEIFEPKPKIEQPKHSYLRWLTG